MKRRFTFLLLAGFPWLSHAMLCPGNFNVIDFGATMEQISQACGSPDSKETKEVKPEGPQEWNYFIPQTVASKSRTQMQGTLKTQITLDKTGKVINLSVNGIGVGSSTICGTAIQLGDDKQKIKAACGEPAYINKTNPADETGPSSAATKVTTFIYNTTPPVKLIFENGVLTKRE